MARPSDLLQGTLDMLILKAVSLGPRHGYGVLLRIQEISGQRLEIQQGSLYPALYRLERQASSRANGGNPRTSGRPASIGSPPPAGGGCSRRPATGTGWPTSSPGS